MNTKALFLIIILFLSFPFVGIAGFDHSKCPGFNEELKKATVMFYDLEMHMDAARRVFKYVKEEDPTNPYAHFFLGGIKIAIGDVDNDAHEHIQMAIKLDESYKEFWGEFLDWRVDDKDGNFYKIHNQDTMVEAIKLVSPSYLGKVVSSALDVTTPWVEKNLEKKATLDALPSRPLAMVVKAFEVGKSSNEELVKQFHRYSTMINDYLLAMIDHGDALYVNDMKVRRPEITGYGMASFADGKTAMEIMTPENKEKYERIKAYIYDGGMGPDLKKAIQNFRIIGIVNHAVIEAPGGKDQIARNDAGIVIGALRKEGFSDERMTLYTTEGNTDIENSRYLLDIFGYLTVVHAKESKKRWIGHPLLVTDVYYLPRNPENIERFNTASDEELLAYAKANIEPGLPDHLRAK